MSSLVRSLSKIKPDSALADFWRREGPALVPSLSKIPEPVDRSILTTIFGIPYGFQFGTAAGMDGGAALAVDLVTDPVGWWLTFGKAPGALTAAGRAAKGARVLGSADSKAQGIIRALLKQGDKQSAMEALVKNTMTSTKWEKSTLLAMQERLGRAASDKEAEAIITAFRAEEVGKSVRGLQTPVDDVRTLSKETVGPQLRLEGMDPSDAAKKVGDQLEEAIPTRITPGEFDNAQIDRVVDAVRAEGREGGLSLISKELAMRDQLVELAQQAAATRSGRDFAKVGDMIAKLNPSPRAQVLFKQNRENLSALVDEIAAGMIPDELVRGGLGAQAQAGQAALLGFRVPFSQIEGTLIKGAGALDTLEGGVRGLQKLLGTPIPESMSLRQTKQGAGLLQGTGAAERRRSQALQLGFLKDAKKAKEAGQGPEAAKALRQAESFGMGKVATFGAVDDALADGVNALKPVAEDARKMQGTADAGTAEIARAELHASKIRFTTEAAMKRLGMDLEVDGMKIIELSHGEGSLVDDAGNLTAKALERGMTEDHLRFAEMFRSHLDDAGLLAFEGNVIDLILRDYFPRIVSEVLDEARYEAAMGKLVSAKKLSKFTPRNLPRVLDAFEDLKKLEAQGIIKLERNPAKILEGYFSSVGRALSNSRTYFNLSLANDAVPVGGRAAAVQAMERRGGLPVFARPGSFVTREFPGEYVTLVDDAVARLAGAIQRERLAVTGKGGRGLTKNGGVAVKKQWANIIATNFAPLARNKDLLSASEQVYENAIRLNAVAKRGLLFWSMFHHMALTESAVATMGADFLNVADKSIVKGWVNTLRGKQGRSFYESRSLIETATQNGLQLGKILDPEVEVVQKMLKSMASGTEKLIGRSNKVSDATRAFARVEMTWNRGLWDYYHNGLKLFAFDTMLTRSYARFPKARAKDLARGTSRFVNNAFGGQVWESFWVSKSGQKALRAFLMAPDWTFSNLRVAMDVFANQVKRTEMGARIFSLNGRTVITAEDLLRADVGAVFARQYALRVGLIFGVMANFVNFAFRGHFMDRNPEGRKAQIQLPWNDAKDRNLFLRFGKQFREPFEVLGDPIGFLRKKAAFTPSQSITQLTGRDYFGKPLLSTEDGPLDELMIRTFAFGKEFIPIPAQQFIQDFPNPTKAISGFMGVPLKTEFSQGGNDVEIPEEVGDMTDALIQSGDLNRTQDELLSLPRFPVGGF